MISNLNNYSIRNSICVFRSSVAWFRTTTEMDKMKKIWERVEPRLVRDTEIKNNGYSMMYLCKQRRCHLLWNEMKDTKFTVWWSRWLKENPNMYKYPTLFNNKKEIIDYNCPELRVHSHIIIPLFPYPSKSLDLVLNRNEEN